MNFCRKPKLKHIVFNKTGCPWKKTAIVEFPQSLDKEIQSLEFPKSGYKIKVAESNEGYDLVIINKDGECVLASFENYENAVSALSGLHQKLTTNKLKMLANFFVKSVVIIIALLVAVEIFTLVAEKVVPREESVAAVQMPLPQDPTSISSQLFNNQQAQALAESQSVPQPIPNENMDASQRQFELSDLNNAFAKGKGDSSSQ